MIDYAHPVYTNPGMAAQARWAEISGVDRVHYCGAYWRWGFHEDGAWSALRVSEALGGRGPGFDAAATRPRGRGSRAGAGAGVSTALADRRGSGRRAPARAAVAGSADLRGLRRPPAAPSPPSTRSATALFMPLFDLDELPELLDDVPLWSARRRAPARFRRSDLLGDPEVPLADAARDLVAERTGARPAGPVRLLANPRYWGVGFNPVAFYYLYGDGPRASCEAMIAEVTNTPWGERRSYVLEAGRRRLRRRASTSGCTSRRSCRWSRATSGRASEPGERLAVSIRNREPDGRTVFEASLALRRRELTAAALRGLLFRYPPMTISTLAPDLLERGQAEAQGRSLLRAPRGRAADEPVALARSTACCARIEAGRIEVEEAYPGGEQRLASVRRRPRCARG